MYLHLLHVAARTLAVCVALAASSVASAGDYPSRPIRIVVPYPPGGGADDVVRFVAQKLSDRLKQPVIVDNRPGATGMIGTSYAAKAPADGYTVVLGHADTMSINPHLFKSISYDARNDFAPVGLLGVRPFVLTVSSKLPVTTFAEFLQLAKSQPGKVTYGSPGVGSTPQIAMLMLSSAAKVNLLHIPYQGAAPAVGAVVAGQVDAMMGSWTVVGPHQEAGRVKILGVTSNARVAAAPQIPTLAEQGLPLSMVDWYGFLVPAKTPAAVVNVLNREFNALVKDPEVAAYLTNQVAMQVAEPMTPQDLRSYVNKAYEQWGKTVAENMIKAE